MDTVQAARAAVTADPAGRRLDSVTAEQARPVELPGPSAGARPSRRWPRRWRWSPVRGHDGGKPCGLMGRGHARPVLPAAGSAPCWLVGRGLPTTPELAMPARRPPHPAASRGRALAGGAR